jgi:hypothetical protein
MAGDNRLQQEQSRGRRSDKDLSKCAAKGGRGVRIRWVLVVLVVLVALAIAVPTVSRHLPHPAAPVVSLPHVERLPHPSYQRGLNVMLYRSSAGIDILPALRQWTHWGVTDVALVIPLTQSGPFATNVGPGAMTPTDAQIRTAVETLETAGFRVMLRPLLDEGTLTTKGYWRGDILPSSIPSWFSHYQAAVVRYAVLAQSLHVAAFDIGSELQSLEPYTVEWVALIHAVRAVYHGTLIYSVNWSDLTVEPWFQQLNEVGLDAYFPLAVANPAGVPSVAEFEQAWTAWLDRLPLYPRPVVITELGVLPLVGSYRAPYQWEIPDSAYSPATQSQYYEAGCDTWTSRAAGIYWWGVTWGSPAQYGPTSFAPTPQAAEVLAACFTHLKS